MRFAMIVDRRPVSSQNQSTESKRRYREALQTQARAIFHAQPLTGPLYARIVWFYKRRADGDVDNIIKPILDALKGIVYKDDRTITKCMSERIDKTRDIQISEENITNELYEGIIGLIADDTKDHGLYIEVGTIVSRQLIFGPIDQHT